MGRVPYPWKKLCPKKRWHFNHKVPPLGQSEPTSIMHHETWMVIGHQTIFVGF